MKRIATSRVFQVFWNKLSILGEPPCKCVDSFSVWSWAHIEMGAHLPLRRYFARFCVEVGIGPFWFIPHVYKLLSGQFVLYRAKKVEVPSLEEILYFYQVKANPMRKNKSKLDF
uniref:Uncharacterized protein n=1 Tax=Cannabis sativa TaxID=3483 RepID=A0A803PLU2_CANSA